MIHFFAYAAPYVFLSLIPAAGALYVLGYWGIIPGAPWQRKPKCPHCGKTIDATITVEWQAPIPFCGCQQSRGAVVAELKRQLDDGGTPRG